MLEDGGTPENCDVDHNRFGRQLGNFWGFAVICWDFAAFSQKKSYFPPVCTNNSMAKVKGLMKDSCDGFRVSGNNQTVRFGLFKSLFLLLVPESVTSAAA
ncbi:hypothetical protein [Thiolapillus sp.]|uniref:hypothetical protein n=1 Tax=Thiolapillus sp. TaxID=2017437 RepID=UPI003AF880E5